MSYIIKAYKFRIYPNKAQKELIHKTFGCCRFVYNFCRAEQKKQEDMYALVKEMQQQGYPLKDYKGKCFNKFENIKYVIELKKTCKWLKEVDKFALESSVENLANAYSKHYKKQGGKPKFKSKKKNDVTSYTTKFTHNNIRIIGKYIKLPKLGAVKFKDKSVPEGNIKRATISYECGKYYVSLTCDNVYVKELDKTNNIVGIDLGLMNFAILSDGIKIPNQDFYENKLNELARLQRIMSRKTIGSSRWKKAKDKVLKLQRHIANQRKDFLHKLTTHLVKKYDILCIEDLDVSKLKETDKSRRNRRVSDVSWYEFRRILTYKCEWYGKTLSVVGRYFKSSQICSQCGYDSGKKDVSIREWLCPSCRTKLDRDINASMNLLKEGLRIQGIQ